MPSFDYRDPVPDHMACIFFIDTSYGMNGDEPEPSERLRIAIENEINAEIEPVDIWPGASFPAWIYEVDLATVGLGASAVALFFSGKKIQENLDAWVELAGRLRRILWRPAHLNRTAAASLGISEILLQYGKESDNILELISYKSADLRTQEWYEAQESEENVRMEYQGVVIHVFDFILNEEKYVVIVNDRSARVAAKDPR